MKKYNANQYGVCIIYDGKEFYYHSKKYNIEEIIKFYIVDNHSKVETIKHFNISDSTLVRIFKHYQIKKSRLLSHEHNKKTCQRRYGNENYNNLDKQRQTLQLKYGVNNYFQKTDYIRNSYIKKLGVSNPNKLKSVRDKIKNTCIKKYGVDSYSKTVEFKEKVKSSCLSKFGVTSPMKSDEIKSKYDFKSIAEKSFKTKLKHGTTNTPKPERDLLNFLIDKFGKDGIEYQYKSQLYPYCCDFYIKRLDLYVELNLFFTHGGHPFNETNEMDLMLLNKWKEKAKTSKFYSNAIVVWTKLDVQKRTIALKNNLKYYVIYNKFQYEQFKCYIKEIQINDN